MKICTKCKLEKDESCFSKRSEVRSGLQSHCKECRAIPAKTYRRENQLIRRENLKKWRIENPEKVREHYLPRREALIKKAGEWKARNPDAVRAHKRRHANKPLPRLRRLLRGRIRSALKGIDKSAYTIELLGCPVTWLEVHLESLFKSGMSWENYGPVWHVDHIKPCAKFDLTNPEQQKICFHWTNLQPLFAKDNLKKGATWQS